MVILTVGLGGSEGVLMRKGDAGRSLKRAENNRERPLPTEERKVSRSVNKPPAVGGWRSVYPSLCSHHFISSSLIFFPPRACIHVGIAVLCAYDNGTSDFKIRSFELLSSRVSSCTFYLLFHYSGNLQVPSLSCFYSFSYKLHSRIINKKL